MAKYLSISLVIIAFMLGTGFGYLISPQYAMNQYEAEQMPGLGKADKYVDLRYINAMIAHHKSAMKLAEQVKDSSKRPEIKALAAAIIAEEPAAIKKLYDWKLAWYNDSSEVATPITANLGSYDENLDLRFLNALITHHHEGIEMAKEIRIKSTRNDILNNSTAVEAFLTSGSKSLHTMRSDWYKIN